MPLPHPIQHEAIVHRHEEVAPEVYWLSLDVGDEFPRPEPGQFVFMRVTDGWDPFLRRPMGVFGFGRTDGRRVLEILYKVVGRGTRLLTFRKRSEIINVIGPLGRRFEMNRRRSTMLVAGGMGVAPLVFLSQVAGGDDVFILGCRSASEFPVDFIRGRLPVPLRVATEDGSLGSMGLASDLAREVGQERGWDFEVAAAGPSPMLAAVAALCETQGVRCQVSLEARMACGVGSCLGCAVPARTPEVYLRACREGPVFESTDILWEALP